jgi:trehalose 2-sulfotransferase
MLASGLRETGIAGRPEEYFAPPVQVPQSELFSMDPQVYRRLLLEHRLAHPASETVADVLSRGTTENGVFGTKIHFQSPFSDYHNAVELLQELHGVRTAPAHILFSMTFPDLSYIWLQRRDRVAQAVSLFRAVKSSEFVRVEGVRESGVRGDLSDADFDYAAVKRFVSWLQSGEEGWRAFFRRSGVQPLIVFYEDFAPAYEETLRSVLEFLKLPVDPVAKARTRHEKQADELSQRWVERFNEQQRRSA